MYSLESPRKYIPTMPPDTIRLTLISSNYPCLEHISMVPNVFEPLKFYCKLIWVLWLFGDSSSANSVPSEEVEIDLQSL